MSHFNKPHHNFCIRNSIHSTKTVKMYQTRLPRKSTTEVYLPDILKGKVAFVTGKHSARFLRFRLFRQFDCPDVRVPTQKHSPNPNTHSKYTNNQNISLIRNCNTNSSRWRLGHLQSNGGSVPETWRQSLHCFPNVSLPSKITEWLTKLVKVNWTRLQRK